MTFAEVAGAAIVAAASFVMGLAGFGIGLVALAFLPYVMSPVTAIALMTIYAFVFSLGMIVPLRREIEPSRLGPLLVGTVAGIPFGVWALATLPPSLINRLIGTALIAIVALEWSRLSPRILNARAWGLAAGALAGVMGGAIGTPGPPVVLYTAAQGWSPRTIKAHLLGFFLVNEGVILAGYWWTGLLTGEVLRLAALLALPAMIGLAAGVALFARIDAARFRRVVFGVLFVSGVVLLLRG